MSFAVYVIATHVNRSENAKIDLFTASHMRVCAQKLDRAFAVYMCMLYLSSTRDQSAVTALCMIVIRVNRSDNWKNRLIYCVMLICMCAKAESCLRSAVCMSYMSCNMCIITLLLLCVCASFNARGVALLLLRFSTVYELNVWVKRCYCSVDVDEIVQLF